MIMLLLLHDLIWIRIGIGIGSTGIIGTWLGIVVKVATVIGGIAVSAIVQWVKILVCITCTWNSMIHVIGIHWMMTVWDPSWMIHCHVVHVVHVAHVHS